MEAALEGFPEFHRVPVSHCDLVSSYMAVIVFVITLEAGAIITEKR